MTKEDINTKAEKLRKEFGVLNPENLKEGMKKNKKEMEEMINKATAFMRGKGK